MDFNNMKDLEAFLQNKINESLSDNVAKTVKDEIQISIAENVYEKYWDNGEYPRVYERRGGNSSKLMGNPLGTGSLADQNEMIATVNNGVLEVTDEADFNNNYDHDRDDIDTSQSLAYNIEYGYGTKTTDYNKPRKFMEKAVNEMQESKSHVQALVNGLIERGITVDGKSFN